MGAILDRNGLRPSRYYVTKDDLVIMASKPACSTIPAGPDRAEGPPAAGPHVPASTPSRAASVADEEIKRKIATRACRIASGSNEHLVHLERSARGAEDRRVPDHETLLHRQIAFGYTFEDERHHLAPMAA